ncbi:MAG: pyridoxine 5'-phosphate synthase [Bacteroidales bacterium]|nr:pyridoxine 5'-phosphate synthase [Candidatus Physcousia equi]
MTKLSVNINKIATIRNARGANNPDVVKTALDCERFGAQGITVHPRPDERHIRHQDVFDLKPMLSTEFNIEGNPEPSFVELVLQATPAQVTLVPDSREQLTSNSGWNTRDHIDFLTEVTDKFHERGIRVSIFVDADVEMVEWAAKAGADRVELYTEPYASNYPVDAESPDFEEKRAAAIAPFVKAGERAKQLGLGLNCGHDLSLVNLAYMHQRMPYIDEVSIGHALICDALYLGLEETIKRYRACLA